MSEQPSAVPSPSSSAAPSAAALYAQDLALVEACAGGCRRSWVVLLERYERTLHYAILNALRAYGAHAPEERVADLQGDLIVALVQEDCRKLRQYSGRSRLESWLKVVATNHALDALRRQRPMVSLDQDAEPSAHLRRTLEAPQEAADEALGSRQLHEALWALAKELPADDQRFIDLFCRHELSFEAIARVMETTVGAVYARKNRVRKKLRALATERGLTPPAA